MVTRMDVQKGVDIALKGLKMLGKQNVAIRSSGCR